MPRSPELLSEAEELAKGWLLTVLGEAPLDELPGQLAPELATDGPRLCDGDRAGAGLRCRLAPARAGRGARAAGRRRGRAGRRGGAGRDPARGGRAGRRHLGGRAVEPARGPTGRRWRSWPSGWRAVLETVRARRPGRIGPARRWRRRPGRGRPGAARGRPRPRPVATGTAAGAAAAVRRVEPPTAWPPPPEAEPACPARSSSAAGAGGPGRDPVARTRAGPSAQEVARRAPRDTPLSLLLIELEDAGRLAAAEPADEVARTFGRVHRRRCARSSAARTSWRVRANRGCG